MLVFFWGKYCVYCDRQIASQEFGFNEVKIDHVQPKKEQGQDAFWNYLPCCELCNSKKSGKPFQEFAASQGKSQAWIEWLEQRLSQFRTLMEAQPPLDPIALNARMTRDRNEQVWERVLL